MSFTLWFDRFLNLTLPPLKIPVSLHQVLWAGIVITIGIALAWLPIELAIVLLGGAIALPFLLRFPFLGIYVLVLVIPFSSLFALSVSGIRIGLMEIILLLIAASWFLSDSLKRKYNQVNRVSLFQSAPLFIPLLIFLSVVILSWLNTLSIKDSLIETIKWVEVTLLYLLVILLVPKQQLRWLTAVIILAGVAQASLGIYQFIFKVGPPGFLLFGGRFLRAYGTFAQPNPYGGYLGLILPLILGLTIYSFFALFDSPNKPKTSKFQLNFFYLFGYGSALSVLLAALFASQSRGAWLAFIIAAATTLIILSRKPGLILMILVSTAALIGLVGAFDWNINQLEVSNTETASGAILQRFIDAAEIITVQDVSGIAVTDSNFATLERLAHWQAAREMWRDHVWLGVGFGNYAAIYPAYAVGRWLDPLGHAHNYILNLGAEAGLIGILGYLIFWIYAFRVTWDAICSSQKFERAVAIGCFGILVHLHTHNLFDNLYVQGMYLYIAIILGISSIIYNVNQNSGSGRTITTTK